MSNSFPQRFGRWVGRHKNVAVPSLIGAVACVSLIVGAAVRLWPNAFDRVAGGIAAILLAVLILRLVGDIIAAVSARLALVINAVGAIAKFFVLPPLALIVGLLVIEDYTPFGRTDALLIMVVLSVWYSTRRIGALLEGRLSTVESLLARIAMQQVPGSTRLEIISETSDAGGTVSTTLHKGNDKPLKESSK